MCHHEEERRGWWGKKNVKVYSVLKYILTNPVDGDFLHGIPSPFGAELV